MHNHEALRSSTAIFSKEPDWVTFYREVLGVEGIVRKLYPTPEAFAEFIKTQEYAEIQRQLNAIREKTKNKSKAEPTRVITVRMPKSLHDFLNWEAEQLHTSVNQLCISKLIQWIEKERVPCASEEELAAAAKKEAAAMARQQSAMIAPNHDYAHASMMGN
jgi:predicted HicB family RNase H-like nuclease